MRDRDSHTPFRWPLSRRGILRSFCEAAVFTEETYVLVHRQNYMPKLTEDIGSISRSLCGGQEAISILDMQDRKVAGQGSRVADD